MNRPELTQTALELLRNPNQFHWSLITMLALVMYVYFNEISKRNWNGVAAGLSLYMVHWFFEILNALIQHYSGHALWTVPAGTGFLLLVGVSTELSLMFSVAGLLLSKILPKDPKTKVLGVNIRILWVVGNAAFFSVFEIFLASTPAFHWVYPWWGALPVFITVYIPFFLAAVWAYYARPERRRIFIGLLFAVNFLMLTVFAGILKWI